MPIIIPVWRCNLACYSQSFSWCYLYLIFGTLNVSENVRRIMNRHIASLRRSTLRQIGCLVLMKILWTRNLVRFVTKKEQRGKPCADMYDRVQRCERFHKSASLLGVPEEGDICNECKRCLHNADKHLGNCFAVRELRFEPQFFKHVYLFCFGVSCLRCL